jgi:hypothetical protein
MPDAWSHIRRFRFRLVAAVAAGLAGAASDARSRLVIIESHTHFRPTDYEGPAHDRLRIIEGTNGDGRADRGAGVIRSGEDWLVVAANRPPQPIREIRTHLGEPSEPQPTDSLPTGKLLLACR